MAKNPKAVQENMVKLQGDREFLQELMADTLREVVSEGTFTRLSTRVKQCHEDKLNMEQAILRCEGVGVDVIVCDIVSVGRRTLEDECASSRNNW